MREYPGNSLFDVLRMTLVQIDVLTYQLNMRRKREAAAAERAKRR